MARKIEMLLRMVSDMRSLDQDPALSQKPSLSHAPNELTDAELDMVAAAVQDPKPMDFKKEKE